MLFACHKDNKPTPPPPNKGNKTYTVKFNVSATGSAKLNTNSLHGNDAAAVPVSTFANILYYWVYDSTGKLVTTLQQDNTVSYFGQITDTFVAGTYNVVMVAQNLPQIPATKSNQLTAPATFSTGFIQLFGNDTFFDTFQLTVTNAAVTQDVTLNRVVGQLQIVITDSIPTIASYIYVNISPYQDLKIADGSPITESDNFLLAVPLPDSVKNKKNYTITTYVANMPATPFIVALRSSNSANATIATATINNVITQVNTRTILSGDLFENGGTGGFTVSFNDTWATDTTVVTFSKRPTPIIKLN